MKQFEEMVRLEKKKRIDIVLRDLSKAGNPPSAFFHNDAIFYGHVARKTP